MIFPAALRPGDTIYVVAPSSPFEHVLGWRGLGFLAERYRLVFNRNALFAKRGYLAGSDEGRRTELQAALHHPTAKAILAARGGYGANRFVHDINFASLVDHPRWIIGFSDITAIHGELARHNVASIHASHLTALGRADLRARKSMLDILENPTQTRLFEGLTTVVKGSAFGPLFGGNLTMLHACAAASKLSVPQGAIVLLEDVTERPYRIDRMLTTLIVGGHFRGVAGFLIGQFTQCDPGPDRITVREVIEERLAGLGVPIVSNAPIGHDMINEPVILGAPTLVEASDRHSCAIQFPAHQFPDR
ncbi:MAG: LD-carboxypeptidase [Polyangiaceae bacterium]|nr:LD-carboxypeptidase [Polyangiaceae bacterium]